ncbi:inositol phosphatase [Babesia caballi]|uniref:Inositol phosphatase n=1 Tax=Babesia caballi TaxID=5871 RepID=A0AAV4LQH7_BABCB|nr:inositol phosphatase [Babesia caballi]
MYRALTLFAFFGRLASASTLLFGPPVPNAFACRNDVYGIGADPQIPTEYFEQVKDYSQQNIAPVLETAFYTGLQNQLAASAISLRRESRHLEEDLVYPSVLYRLSLFVAKDYVRCHTALADLHLLKMLHVTQRMLLGYANSAFTEEKHVIVQTRRYKYCSAVVYVEIAKKLASYRRERSELLETEVKRLVNNANNISSVKTTGKLWLLVDAFCAPSLVLIMGAPLLLFGLGGLF